MRGSLPLSRRSYPTKTCQSCDGFNFKREFQGQKKGRGDERCYEQRVSEDMLQQ